ncbi:MAG: hypothetical protein KGD74_08995 [Candidatus Lokiarchaeota archaeon]|nr:hypothetical protein [Candidatus Lokiarchaeota archaeon]
MVKISKLGEDFLLLALRIGKHIKGYVDFYIGPENLKQLVENESLTSPNKLLNDSNALIKQLRTQGYSKERERYIEKLLVAMKTSIEILKGSPISIKEQISRLYDVSLQPVNESKLYDLKEEINKAYMGSGSLEARLKEIRVQRKVAESDVFDLFKRALEIVKNRTNELLTNFLPKNETIIIDLVEKKENEIKWSYYNWYLGNYSSRIEVNPSYDIFWSSFLSAAAHEGYPGHHTEFVVKEQCLFRELFQFEHSILLMNSPKLIISEGIANLAINMLYSYRDQAEISVREFCRKKTDEDSLDNITNQYSVRNKMNLFVHNLAYHALIDEWSNEQLVRYATSFEILSKENVDNQIKLLNNPVHATTDFSYSIGSNLIVDKYGEFPSMDNFFDLLTKPVLPSDLI